MCRELWKFFSISFLVEKFFPFYAHLPPFFFSIFSLPFLWLVKREKGNASRTHNWTNCYTFIVSEFVYVTRCRFRSFFFRERLSLSHAARHNVVSRPFCHSISHFHFCFIFSQSAPARAIFKNKFPPWRQQHTGNFQRQIYDPRTAQLLHYRQTMLKAS
jgi:hypothetical protein